MKCKSCGYRLWNIASRQCPECGTHFMPSDFEFTPNAVQYLCPHCHQSYYGTDEKGHLVPPVFDCVNCQQHVDMDQMILLPTEGVTEEKTRLMFNPWCDDKEERGALSRWWQTFAKSLTSPARLMEATPATSSSLAATSFFFMNLMMVLLPTMLMLVVLFAVLAFSAGGMQKLSGLFFVGAGITLGFVAIAFVVMLAWSAVTHVLLRMFGKPAYGYGRTFQTFVYTSSPLLLLAIPCLNLGIYPMVGIWWVIAAAIALTLSQKIGGGLSAAATLSPPLLFAALLISGSITLGIVANSTVFNQRVRTMPSTSLVTDALAEYHVEHGAFPTHGVFLVTDGNLLPADLVSQRYGTDITQSWVGDLTLDAFDVTDAEKLQEELQLL